MSERRFLLQIAEGGSLTLPLRDVPALSTFSLELWVNVSRDVDQTILRSNGIALQVRDGRLRAVVADRTLRGRRVVANDWYHVAVIVEQRRARLYINGSLVTRTELAANYDDALGIEMVIGGQPVGRERAFVGRVDNLRVLSVPLARTEGLPVSSRLGPADGVVFAFDFDSGETPGETIAASNGTYRATLQSGAAVVPGAI